MNTADADINDLLGAVMCKNYWRIFLGSVAEWILDYATYDPTFDPSEWTEVFRNNLLRVDETLAEQNCSAMQPYELTPVDVKKLLREQGANYFPLAVVIDFDKKVVVNGFFRDTHTCVCSTWMDRI
jgi:hypothetical protein